MDRRSFLIGTTALAVAGPAAAQDVFPAHAITIINAFPPGGANDIVTRPLAAAMEPILKQPVVVETKAGAAGAVGAQIRGQCQAGRLHFAFAQHRHFRLRRSRQTVRPPGEDAAAPISSRWRG